jgi:hypothetical protein
VALVESEGKTMTMEDAQDRQIAKMLKDCHDEDTQRQLMRFGFRRYDLLRKYYNSFTKGSKDGYIVYEFLLNTIKKEHPELFV